MNVPPPIVRPDPLISAVESAAGARGIRTNSTNVFPGTQVVSIADDKPVRLVIEGFTENNESLFFNSLNGEQQPNFQMLYALGPGKYINSFSQRLSPYVIEGLYLTTGCEQQKETQAVPAFVTFYEENNIVARTFRGDGPMRITFLGLVLEAYLIKLVIGSYQKEGIDGHTFALHVLAEISDPASNEQTAAGDASSKAGKSDPPMFAYPEENYKRVGITIGVSPEDIIPNYPHYNTIR